MACDRVKVLAYPEGMYVLSTGQPAPPCKYTIRWCPKAGQIELLGEGAAAEQVVKIIREHRVLGDTIEHLMELALV